MPSARIHSSTVIITTFDQNRSIAQSIVEDEILDQCAKRVRQLFISFDPLAIHSNYPPFAEREDISKHIEIDKEKIKKIIASDYAFRKLLDGALTATCCKKQSAGAICSVLDSHISAIIDVDSLNALYQKISDQKIINRLSFLLSKELVDMHAANNCDVPQKLTITYCLLTQFLRSTGISLKRLGPALVELSGTIIGLPGNLLSMQNYHSSDLRKHAAMPIISFRPIKIISKLRKRSSVVNCVQNESLNTFNEKGFVTRSMPNNISGQFSQAQEETIIALRRLSHPHLEYTCILFMALTSLEFILRSVIGTQNSREELQPAIEGLEYLHPDLREKIKKIFAASGWNIRNRCLHGSLLETASKREDIILSSGILIKHQIPLLDNKADFYLPKNLAALTTSVLEELCRAVDKKRSSLRIEWTRSFNLTDEETAYLNQIPCDILDSYVQMQGWWEVIKTNAYHLSPAIAPLLGLGLISWVSNNQLGARIPYFYFLVLTLEPLIRMTLQLVNQPILDVSLKKSSTYTLKVQFKMLDKQGLLSQPNLDALTEHLNLSDRQAAQRTLQIAMKCRDAVAHGAIYNLSNNNYRLYGHAIVKCIQLVTECAIHHMTSVFR